MIFFVRSVATTIFKKFSFSDSNMDDIAVLLPENPGNGNVTTLFHPAELFLPIVACTIIFRKRHLTTSFHPSEDANTPIKNKEVSVCWQEIVKMNMEGTTRLPNLCQLVSVHLACPSPMQRLNDSKWLGRSS